MGGPATRAMIERKARAESRSELDRLTKDNADLRVALAEAVAANPPPAAPTGGG